MKYISHYNESFEQTRYEKFMSELYDFISTLDKNKLYTLEELRPSFKKYNTFMNIQFIII